MKKRASLLAVLLLVMCAEAFAAENPRAEFEERRRAVAVTMEAATVWIVTEDSDSIGYGSGFIVGDGYIVTNAHVVANLKQDGTIYVLNDLIPARKARIVKTAYDDPEGDNVGGRDFALLRFDAPQGVALPTLTFNLDVKRMDRISAWGYPLMSTKFDVRTEQLQKGDTRGLESPPVIYTEGTVNAIVRARRGEAILHSAQIAGGNSGGPLVNGKGEVVGMNTWNYREEDEGALINGAQLASELCSFLSENGVTPKLADGQKLLPPRQRPKAEESAGGQAQRETKESRRRNVGDFSVLVPHGWSVADEEKNMIMLGADNHSAAVVILISTLDGEDLSQAVKQLSKELGGTKPKLDDDVYIFTYTSDDVDTTVFVSDLDDGERFLMISISGDAEQDKVSEILDSIKDK